MLLASGALLAQAPPRGSGDITFPGFVRAIEGDTFEAWIRGSRVGIGLIGVRAPMGNTACGRSAIALAQNLVRGGVRLEEDLNITFDDRKRRMYYLKRPGDGALIALALVSAGVARADGTGREAAALLAAQADASANRRGCLWDGSPNPIVEREAEAPEAKPENGTPHMAAVEPPAIDVSPPAASYPSGFTHQVIAGGLTNATAFAFLPDGRILVALKSGVVRVIKNGVLLTTPFIDIRDRVNDYWDRGLLGIAADPGFATNNRVYLFYTYEDNPAQYNGTKTARLTRVTAVGDTASPTTETTILGRSVGPTCKNFPAGTDCISADSPSHSAGAIRFAPDGTMFAAIGDGAHFNIADPDALRAQNPDLLTGKILRITTAGAGVAGNPFYGDPNANRSKFWSYGMRNPFRFHLRAGTNVPYIGDVGWSTWEEVTVDARGSNLGWPCYEGSARNDAFSTYPECQSLYNT